MTPLEQLEELKSRIRKHTRVSIIHRDYIARSKEDIIELYKKTAAQQLGRQMLDDGAIKIEMEPDEANENVILTLTVATVAPREVLITMIRCRECGQEAFKGKPIVHDKACSL